MPDQDDNRHFRDLTAEEKKSVRGFLQEKIDFYRSNALEQLEQYQKYVITANTGGVGGIVALLAVERSGWPFLIAAAVSFVAGLCVALVWSYRTPNRLGDSTVVLIRLQLALVSNEITVGEMNRELKDHPKRLGFKTPDWVLVAPLVLFVTGVVIALLGLVVGYFPEQPADLGPD